MNMDEKLRGILRAGLMSTSQDKRTELIRQLRNHPQTEDRNRVEAALKDSSTRIDDIERVEAGQHISDWKKRSQKVNESFFNGERDDWGSEETEQEFSLPSDIPTDESDFNGLEVDVAEVVNRTEFGVSRYGKPLNLDTTSKVNNAMSLFDKLSERDKKKISEAILEAVEEEKSKRVKRPTGKQFCAAVNSQLDEEEMIVFVSLLLAKIDTPFATKVSV